MTEETLTFQAEVSRLLDIVANALYSQDEVFLRELVSNASDACDRLRYAAISEPSLSAGDPELRIELTPDKEAGTLTVADNGIGMNREELIENLGTIARSGTAAFVQALGEKKGEVEQIGQFGVGFYAAFMVAGKVEVFTRKAGEEHAWHWVSDGKGSFTVGDAPEGEAPARGTRIVLHLKEDKREYVEPHRLRHVVKTYSDHIAVPVRLLPKDGEPETLNSAGALWTRPKSEISDEQYAEFYHHVAHAADEPWTRLHFKAEGTIEYTGLLFVPGSRPFDLFDPQRKSRVKLYVKRVFITDDCEALVPPYLRFLRGIVDSEDLPLNISREMFQHHPVLHKIRQALTKRVLAELESKAESDAEGYAGFWQNFGAVLKEGLYEDNGQQEALLKLARFRSTAPQESGQDGWVSLADYVARMKPGQKAIYTIAGDDAEKLKRSPQLEGFRAKGVEVLLLTDPVDEFWPSAVGGFEDKPFRSVTRGGAELDEIEAEAKQGEDETKQEEAEAGPETATLVAFLKQSLGARVKDVRPSQRLTESAVCLVAEEGDMDLHLAKLLKQHQQLDEIAPRVLEVNPKHPLIRQLAERLKAGNGAAEQLEPYALLLLDQARILEGEAPLDPAGFAQRMTELAAKSLA